MKHYILFTLKFLGIIFLIPILLYIGFAVGLISKMLLCKINIFSDLAICEIKQCRDGKYDILFILTGIIFVFSIAFFVLKRIKKDY